MKILVVGPGKMKYMPYAHFYLGNIDAKKHEIHVAYWNRDEKAEDLSQFKNMHLHEFKKFMLNDAPLTKKVHYFYLFRKFCLGLIRQYNYDFIIVLHSLPGVMLYDYLVGKYKNKYIFDYRDSTYEPRVRLFKAAVGNLIRNSSITFTSSDGFREYFPSECNSKVITSHNLLEDSLLHRDYHKVSSDRIRLSFWGFIRHVELNKYLIDRIGQDSRFELHYYGREQIDALTLKEYVKTKGYNSIYFHGEYKPEDRYQFVKNTDLIHNTYLDTNTLRAMGNKYYDGVIFRIPQICFPDSQMGKMCDAAHIGVSLDPRNIDFCNQLYAYYHSIDWDSFNKSCDIELKRIMEEYDRGRSVIHHIIQ